MDTANWSPLEEAETLLVPFVVSLINLVIPLFYSLFNKFEHYSNQRRQIYALILRLGCGTSSWIITTLYICSCCPINTWRGRADISQGKGLSNRILNNIDRPTRFLTFEKLYGDVCFQK